jgi:S1-C subfamily serine protease
MNRTLFREIGFVALVSGVLLLLFGIYHHHSLEQLRIQQDARLEAITQVLEQQINDLKVATQEGIAELSSTLTEQDEAILQEIATLDEQYGEVVSDLQSQVDEQGKKTQKQLTSLVGAIDDVRTVSEQQISSLQDNIAKIKTQNADFSGILDEVIASVVSVSTNVGSGSGVIVDSRGYLVTNYHVVSGATAASIVTSDGKAHATYMVGYNANIDLALLRIEGTFDALPFGDSDDANVGERVIAVGNPGGLDFTVTEGIISAKNRAGPNGVFYLQHDVPINPGNSGGPLVDASGRIVGINTLKFDGFEGIGFAIPANTVETFVDNAIATEEAS